MKKYKKAENGTGPMPYDPKAAQQQFQNYSYGTYPNPNTRDNSLPPVTVKNRSRFPIEGEIVPRDLDMSFETPSYLDRNPSLDIVSNQQEQPQYSNMSEYLAAGLTAIDALIPATRNKIDQIRQLDYNPRPQGTGSQAIMKSGGKLQKGSWKSNYFMDDGGKFKKVQPRALGAESYSPYGDTTGTVNRNLTKMAPNKLPVKPAPITKKQSTGIGPANNYGSDYDNIVPNAPTNSLERLDSAYNVNWDKYENFRSTDTTDYGSNEPFIPLTSGKFNTGKAPERMVQDLVKAAKNNGIDPYTMLGLAGQESTFGFSGKQGNSQNVISGWDVGSQYRPSHYSQFLADKGVPGITTKKGNHGYSYDYDPNQLNSYLDQNPELMNQYFDKLNSMQRPDKFSYFDEAAKQIKNKGVKSYNPGDPRYEGMVNESANQLRKDKNLSKYVSSLKSGGKIKYKEGAEYDLSQEEIDNLIAQGYELKLK